MGIGHATLARFTVAAAFAGMCAWAPRPAAGEFPINTYTTSQQYISRGVAGRSATEYIAVWTSFQDASGRNVYAQRFTPAGARIGSEFRVNVTTPFDQQAPAVAADGSGGFIVVWSSDGQDGDGQGVFGRRYDAATAPAGSEFVINSYTTSSQGAPALAVHADGSFVVTWTSYGQDGDRHGIFGQRFDAAGARAGAEFQVNTYTTGTQAVSSMAADAAARFVVVWRSRTINPTSEYGVYGQRFAADGTRLGAEMRLTPGGTGDQTDPAVAVRAGGEFIVVWRDFSFTPAFRTGIRGQWFDPAGTASGAEFTVSSFPAGSHRTPAAAFDADSNLLVVWTNADQDGYFDGVFGQRFDAAGARRGTEFRVNSYTMFSQEGPAVASAAAGSYMVAWSSFNQDGDGYGVFGDVFGDIQPEFLRVDAAGNGVFEAGETASVNPAWRNVSGTVLAFSGSVTSFTGPGTPGDPTYTIADGTADYGTVSFGAVSDCVPAADCYSLATTVPTSRPAFHWDATFHEDLAPAAPGRSKNWTLHVGESFADVPTSNPFYRFVETLVHIGATGGCQAGAFCPLQATSRAAMAVFVLVAKEGPGYAPPPCGATPMFADVPVTSPFCRWVEELARRGVVGGCGGGNYCPLEPATREQMAIFVLRALDPAMNPPPCVPPNFYTDVPESSPFCRWIEELTRRGVVSGCGGGNYCPTASVTREQVSAFVTVTFGLVLYGP